MTTNTNQDIAAGIEGLAEDDDERHPFFMFEPFDIAVRSRETESCMRQDRVWDLLNDETFCSLFGMVPRPFQSGFLTSTNPLRIAIGGSRIGKSIMVDIEVGIMVSGERPYALRFPKGVNTGIKRLITPENIRRFGRRDCRTGEMIDHTVQTQYSGRFADREWDCGNIEGVGLYPESKICPAGKQLWIGSLKESIAKHWEKNLQDPIHFSLPTRFLDMRRGNGFNVTKKQTFFVRDITLFLLSYELGHIKFESEEAWGLWLDEEAPYEQLWTSAEGHSKWRALLYTPLRGITWSRKLVFNRDVKADRFHATQFDSPYVDQRDLALRRSGMSLHIRHNVLYGMYSEAEGDPYFDRDKLQTWLQSNTKEYRLVSFEPTQPYDGIIRSEQGGKLPLIECTVKPMEETEDNQHNVWRVYEDRIQDAAYVIASDHSEGGKTLDEVRDFNAAVIGRVRFPDEAGDPNKPVIVAVIRSGLETIPFSRVVLFAARYYNNATLAPESRKSASNAAFVFATEKWPYWYMHTEIAEKTNSQKVVKGFDTTDRSKGVMMGLLREWIDTTPVDEDPQIKDETIIKQLIGAQAMIGKDQVRRLRTVGTGKIDVLMAFAILCYVFARARSQIACHQNEDDYGTTKRKPGLLESIMNRQNQEQMNPFPMLAESE